jgi:hypothetical protein
MTTILGATTAQGDQYMAHHTRGQARAELKTRRTRRYIAGLTAVMIGASGLVVAAVPFAASAAPSDVTGLVYRDFNSNGAYDTTGGKGVPRDIGLGGVSVTAYDALGDKVGDRVKTARDGTYTLTGAAADQKLRVEFTDLPAGYESSFSGGTSVQFVTAGQTDVRYAVNAPEDYSNAAAEGATPLVTPIQYAGDPSNSVYSAPGTKAKYPAIVATPWNAYYTNNQAAGFPSRTTLATFDQVGSIWGTAFQASTNSVYAAATYKRHSGLGALGIGGIYRISDALALTGTLGSPTFAGGFTVQGMPIVGSNQTVDVGAALSNTKRDLKGPSDLSTDPDAFAKAAKIGIGAITVSADQKTLYFVNLYDRNLYSIDISTPDFNVIQAKGATLLPLGLSSTQQPWAITQHRGELYVGYVDIGTAGSRATASMGAHVIRADASAPTSWTAVLDFPLDYVKGNPIAGSDPATAAIPQLTHWNGWVDEWSGVRGENAWSVSLTNSWGLVQSYPQPVLSNLEFDTGGFLNLGFADRTSFQGGNRNVASNVTLPSTKYYESVAGGDLLIAAPTADGTKFTVESGGTVGNSTVGVRGPSSTATNTQGPGGGEFYNDLQNLGKGTNHQENTLGGLATLAGVDQIVSTSYDPLAGIRLAGLSWFSSSTGAPSAGYELTADGQGGTFQKGGGLGDVQALTQQAPIQIGNRVWFDADQNGRQDADEPALPNVTVELWQNDKKIGSTVTNANGEYYFSSTDPDLVGKFVPNGGAYTVTFVKPDTGLVPFTGADAATFGSVSWADVSFTKQETAGTNGSDADPVTGSVIYQAGAPGENDHDIDAGFIANASYTVEKKIDLQGGALVEGTTFILEASATDFRGTALPTETIELTPTGTPATATSDTYTVPVGTSVQVTEPGTPNDVVSQVTISPAASFLVTGRATTPTTFTVLNRLRASGSFEVTKELTGDQAPQGTVTGTSPAPAFTVNYSYTPIGGESTAGDPFTVTAGHTTTSPALPYGATVVVSEVTPVVTGIAWGQPSWIIDGGAPQSGTGTFTIGDGTKASVLLKNPVAFTKSGFAITKSVSGGAAGSVKSSNMDFTVHYESADGTFEGDLTVTKGVLATSRTDIPFGTVLTLSEITPVDGTPSVDVGWAGATFATSPGVVPSANGRTATVTVGDSTASVQLNNGTTVLTGQIDITKSVTGQAEYAVPAGAAFPVSASYIYNGVPVTKSATVNRDTTVTIDGIPLGVEITLTEGIKPVVPGNVAWQLPVFTGIGVTDNGDGTATLIAGAHIAVGLENPTTEVNGSFTITKAVTGSASSSVPAKTPFTVNYTYDYNGTATGGSLTVVAGVTSNAVTGIPTGTVVTVSEVRPADGTPAADVTWKAPIFTGPGVTVNSDGSASFTVTEPNLPVAVLLENPTERQFGSFSITKRATGEAAETGQVDPAFKFTGTYSYNGVQKQFSLAKDATWTLPSDEKIPAGTVITLAENAPDGGLPAQSGWGTPVFTVDGVQIDGNSITLAANSVVGVTLTNPTTVTPKVDIEKGDGNGTTIVHDADTMDDAQLYQLGETRTIVFTVKNSGTERLRDVKLTDATLSGAQADALTWTFPDGSTAAATRDSSGALIATWDATFGATPSSLWEIGDTITGTATLTVNGSDAPHVNSASVDAIGYASGTPVTDVDNYNAYTAGIQVIKYDGNAADPQVQDADGNWIVPAKPLVNASVDANDAEHSVLYPAGKAQRVRWVTTNTGNTFLTEIGLADVTGTGPSIESWTADLSAFGGPAKYDFVANGTWHGVIPPGASFFSEGLLTLQAATTHQDTVTVTGSPVVPEVDAVTGVPTGKPAQDGEGNPILHKDGAGNPVVLSDSDPFNAHTVAAPVPASGGHGLAGTGVNPTLLWLGVAGGLAALLLGAFLLLAPRRRMRHHA